MNRPPTAHPWVLSFWRVPSWLALIVLALDQLTKLLVLRAWPTVTSEPPVTLIPGFFSLVHYQNTGAAWGILSNHTSLLALLSLVVFVAMIVYFRRLTEDVPERAIALGVVLGGVIGNLLDRLFRPGVVDFLLFYWRDWRKLSFPAFNVADTAITCGIAVYIISSFLRGDLSRGAPAEAGVGSDA